MLVSETRLGARREPQIQGFITYHSVNNIDPKYGGTAIYVKRGIDHSHLPLVGLQNLEATAIVLNTLHGPIQVVSAYQPPRKPILKDDLTLSLSHTQPTILAGDLNSKSPFWNSRVTNRNGRLLQEFIDSSSLNIRAVGPEQPTFFHVNPEFRPDVLDIALLCNLDAEHDIWSPNELSSDHNPVIMDVALGIDRPARVFKSTDWQRYKAKVESSIGPLPFIKDIHDLEAAVSNLTSVMQAALDSSTTSRLTTQVEPLAIPPDLRSLIAAKKTARHRWQRTRDPLFRTESRRLALSIRDKLREIRNDRWERRMEAMNDQANSVWKFIRSLKRRSHVQQVIHGERGLAFTDSEKAEAFADSLERQFTPNPSEDDDFISEVEASVTSFISNTDGKWTFQPATSEELNELIKQLKTRKAPGHDGISTQMVKNLSRKGRCALLNIANAVMRLGHFPNTWKLAAVINILKAGKNPTFPQHYRPISLLSVLGKLVEKILLRRIQVFADDRKIIPDSQAGFRAGMSTLHQLLRVTEYITEGFNIKRDTSAVFLDVSKAFDRVWHDGLIYKMIILQFPEYLVQVMHNFLRDRKFCSKINDKFSSTREILAGVPQGSALSPTLFNIFTSDIPNVAPVMIAQYADDTALLYRGRTTLHLENTMQGALDSYEEWANQWRLAINAEKSVAMHFSRPRKRKNIIESPNLTFDETPIPLAEEVKYLGIILDRHLTWSKSIAHSIQKANASLKLLWPLTNSKSKLSIKNRVKLYKMMIRPQLTYAAPVWGYCRPSLIDKLQRRQNVILRRVLNAPLYMRNSQIHRDTKMPSVSEVVRETAVNFYSKLDNDPPSGINFPMYDVTAKCKHRRPRHVLIGYN